MIPQHTVLYAVDTRPAGKVYLVVGWRESPAGGHLLPVLAPVQHVGGVYTADGILAAELRYSATDPRPPRPRPETVPARQMNINPPPPGNDSTVVMPSTRLRP